MERIIDRARVAGEGHAVVEFGQLPEPTGRQASYGKWSVIADELRSHPGEWAKVDAAETVPSARNRQAAIRNGRLSGMPRGQFEAVTRGLDIWARFVGQS